ncbi:MAG: hypothetical protein U0974_12765 [Gemmatimonadales bacterium]|nr:hypothetical protein [Gemmatimonadales bacterium]MDZ4390589.1 hypothetical protein [Gemmatimonadales bacterium]
MPKALKFAVALIAGVVVGGAVNMGIITAGPLLVTPPPGTDMTTAEGIKAAMPLLEPRHFLVPFLAHAFGTLAGAFVGAMMLVSHRSRVAFAIGGLYLVGGIMASLMIPAPAWFIATDLLLAYLPMAWLGLRGANKMRPVITA